MVDVVWMYWEDRGGRRRAPYLDLCLETIRCNAGSCEIRVLDQESALEWLPDTSPDVWRGLRSPVQRADYARTRLVYHHGGLWADVDTIALRPLSEVTALLGEADVVGWGRELEGRFYSNLFAANPGAALIGKWMQAQDELIRSTDVKALPYAALGHAVEPFVGRHPYLSLPMGRVAPVPWYCARQLCSRVQSPRRVLEADPYVVVLWNKAIGRRMRERSAEEVLGDATLLSRLLRIGLHRSTPEEESRGLARLDPVGRLRFMANGRRVENKARLALWKAGRILDAASNRREPGRRPA